MIVRLRNEGMKISKQQVGENASIYWNLLELT